MRNNNILGRREEEKQLPVVTEHTWNLWRKQRLQLGLMHFFEVHPDPDNALSDGPNMVKLDEFETLLQRVMKYMMQFIMAKGFRANG